ncbi:uncharacterized protein LOC128674879 [Plodia interpunctella]|uniref:uncharacterized protein LOC128674879 n=1 Tax=Plodia interpunctella TaxID=58824 RepID=UPI0023674914|nr:uncharacterized protein LOC128674879 [Plodia interpunctella]
MTDGKKEKDFEVEVSERKTYGLGIRHLQMVSMSLTMIALFMARGSMGVAVLAMSDGNRKNDTNVTIYDWDKRTQSVILSSFFWGYVVMQMPAGIIAKKFGGKPIILVSLVANGTICLLIPTLAALGGWPLVCASRVVMGLTQACLYPGSHTLLGQWLPPKEQTSYTGIVYGGVQVGTILTMPISGFLAETALGWKTIFYTMSAVLYTTATFWYFFAASSPKSHRMISQEERLYIESGLNPTSKKNIKIPWKAILKTKSVYAILVPQVGYSMSFVLFFVDLPTYIEKGLQISLKNSAILSALPYLGMLCGGILSSIIAQKMLNLGWHSKIFSRKLFTSVALFGVASGLITLSFMGPENRIAAVATLITTLTLSGAATAGHTVNQLDISPNYAGVLMGFLNFVANIGCVCVPLITGLILGKDSIDVSRWRIVFLLHAGISITSNIIFMIFGSSERQAWDDPDYLDKVKADLEETQPALANKEKEAEEYLITSNIEIHLKLFGENADGVKSHPELKMTNEKQVECLEKYGLEGKTYGIGIRHLQMFSMSLTIVALFMARGSMGVAVLAMSDGNRKNDTNVTIYDWDKRTQSLILSSFFWGYVVMQVPAGIIAKKFGGKPILLFALLANGTICLLIPTLASLGGWPLVCASRVMMGLTQACLFPGSHTLLGQWLPPKEQTSFTGVVYGGVQIGTILTMPISGFLSETALGWKMIFYTLSGVLYVTAAFWYWFAASAPKFHRMISVEERFYIESGLNSGGCKKNVKTPWKAILKTRALWAVLAPHIGFAMGFVLFFVDLPTYLEKGLQISLKNSALLSALPYAGMWCSSIVSSIVAEKMINLGWHSKIFSRKLFTSIAFYGLAGGLITLSFFGPENRNTAIAVLISSLSISGAASAGHMVNQLDISPNYAGLLLAFTNFIANIFTIMVPIITGLILGKDSMDVSRWRIVFLLHAGISITSNTVFMIFGSADRQAWDDPDFIDKIKADPEESKPVLSKGDKEAEPNKVS